ncbi:GNAT family N-acetyltransferase [Haloarcula hispanica]|uniref:GNAT family N-acetyltransferase n=1 Tax=Haloarcula hispanica TaxID=51589 RepID=A0A482TE64_HALHI|nr:GNAT family N-acetyltransferase [Haloarcula hispanica]MCJ0620357.1 GNAT family N-acetyltransferase [Haloarcula hispanica]RYJ10765.1 GNAT family N-acetyltransferase [Haloarcula hispanica]
MADLTLRRYRPADADAVWDLHERALRDAGGWDEAFAHRDTDLRSVQSEYLDAGGEFLVGHRHGSLVAMGAFHPHVDDADAMVLRRMRVDPAHQRRGYGTRVLNELEARARKRGYDRAELDTTTVQTAAMAFYEQHGYEQVGEEYVDPADMTLVFYEKNL